MQNKETLAKYLVLVLFVSVIFIFHHWGYIGHYGFDDMEYAEQAHNLEQGRIDFSNHYSYRWVITFPTALSYKLFGISDFSSALPGMILGSLILAMVFVMVYRQNMLVITMALALATLTNWNLFYTDKLMPDIHLTFAITAIILSIWAFRFRNPGQQNWLFALWLSLSFFVGFLAKETIVFVIPFLLILFLVDVIQKRYIRFWLFSGLFTALLFAGYFLLIATLTGSPDARFTAIAAGSYLNRCSYGQQPVSFLLRRIGYEFFEMMIKQGMFVGLGIMIAACIDKMEWKLFSPKNETGFFLFTSVLLVLSSNFLTISLKFYNPLCLDPRHYLFLIPILAIVSAYYLNDWLQQKKKALLLIVIFVVLTFVSFHSNKKIAEQLYIPLLASIGLWTILPKGIKNIRWAFVLVFVGILTITPWQTIKYAAKINYNQQKEDAIHFLTNTSGKAIIITDNVEQRLLRYYDQFDKDSRFTFLNFAEADSTELSSNQPIYLVMNNYTQGLSATSTEQLPIYARINFKGKHLIFDDSIIPFKIFRLDDIQAEFQQVPVFSTINTFESPVANWKQDSAQLINQYAFQGKTCYRVPKYSATFEYSMDSLKKSGNLNIELSVYLKSLETTTAKLVISIDTPEGSTFWKSYNIDSSIKSYGAWWPLHMNEIIEESTLKKSSILKVYVLNEESNELYLDDFKVTINLIH